MSTRELFVPGLDDYPNSTTSFIQEARVSREEAQGHDLEDARWDTEVSMGTQLSEWSDSAWKRIFDFVCVFCALPLLLPLMLVVALAVRITSAGPAFFLQKRMGRNGHVFTIVKFRTMVHEKHSGQVVTTSSDHRFTPIGPFLRRWKLDEVPQLLNVLAGQMSLVGPRPKVPEHEPEVLHSRPGVTGAATIVFAREERALDRIPREDLNAFYNSTVLPTKRQLDAAYMARATFSSDLMLILKTVAGRWDIRLMETLLRIQGQDKQASRRRSRAITTWVLPRLVPSSMRVADDLQISMD